MGQPLVTSHRDAEIVGIDVRTGKRTSLATVARRALNALNAADVPYAVVGATALAVRGLPRNTADIDVVVLLEDAFAALDALAKAGFRSITPVRREEDRKSVV